MKILFLISSDSSFPNTCHAGGQPWLPLPWNTFVYNIHYRVLLVCILYQLPVLLDRNILEATSKFNFPVARTKEQKETGKTNFNNMVTQYIKILPMKSVIKSY